MTTITRTVMVLAGLAGTLLITPAFAQSSDSALEEIIVTAERREENLQEVPIAVTAMSRLQLEDLQVTEARDLQRYVPSLNMFNNITTPTNLSLSMRGGLQQDASLVTAESPIGIYVDDIYVARLNGNNVTLSDIERVEVLRGPQGTLYGRNTGFGAIKFVSRTPGEDAWFDATVGGGNWDQLLFSASVGGPLGDSWAGSLSGRYYEKADQFHNAAENVDTGSEENLSMRGKLRYMGENFDAVLSVSYSDSETDSLQLPHMTTPGVPSDQQFTTEDLVPTNGDYTTNTAWGPQVPPPFGDKPHGETEQTIVGLTLTWDFSDTLTFKSITGYVTMEDFFQTDFNGNTADPSQAFLAGGFAVQAASIAESDQITQEFQLLGTAMDDRLSYLVGAYYLNEQAEQPFGWSIALVPTPTGTIMGPVSESFIDTEVDAWAVFGDVSFNFTDNLRGTAGVRYSDDDKGSPHQFPILPGPVPAGSDFRECPIRRLVTESRAGVQFHGLGGHAVWFGGERVQGRRIQLHRDIRHKCDLRLPPGGKLDLRGWYESRMARQPVADQPGVFLLGNYRYSAERDRGRWNGKPVVPGAELRRCHDPGPGVRNSGCAY